MSEANYLGRAEEQAGLALAGPPRVVAVGASAGGLDAFGLSIVSPVVRVHGGSVRAESAGIGRGATFTVTLPMVGEPIDAKVINLRRRGDRKERSTEARIAT